MSERASVMRRLAASMYEVVLLAAVAMVVEFALLPLLSALSGPSRDDRALPLLARTAQAISLACLFAVLGCYCVWGWSGGRRTLPMKTWRIAMEVPSRTNIGMGTAARRYAACWIGPALAVAAYAMLRPLGLGRWAVALLALNYAWALWDRDRQFLHDRVAGTRLVAASQGPLTDSPAPGQGCA